MSESKSKYYSKSQEKDILLLEEEGFSIKEVSSYSLEAEKQSRYGKLRVYFTKKYGYSFQMFGIMDDMFSSFNSNDIKITHSLNKDNIYHNQKCLDLIMALNKSTLDFLKEKKIIYQANRSSNSYNEYYFGLNFRLASYANGLFLGIRLNDSIIVEIRKEDILDKDIGWLYKTSMEIIKSELDEFIFKHGITA